MECMCTLALESGELVVFPVAESSRWPLCFACCVWQVLDAAYQLFLSVPVNHPLKPEKKTAFIATQVLPFSGILVLSLVSFCPHRSWEGLVPSFLPGVCTGSDPEGHKPAVHNHAYMPACVEVQVGAPAPELLAHVCDDDIFPTRGPTDTL